MTQIRTSLKLARRAGRVVTPLVRVPGAREPGRAVGPPCQTARPWLQRICLSSPTRTTSPRSCPGPSSIAGWTSATPAEPWAFPSPPVEFDEVAPAAERLIDALDSRCSRLVVATVDGTLAGWLNICRDPHPLVAHWGMLHHVQSHPRFRGRGIGSALMNHARQIGRDEMGLEQLHLAARAGTGLEEFYGRLGWTEIGRWPGALRLGPDDDRDEILMVLDPL